MPGDELRELLGLPVPPAATGSSSTPLALELGGRLCEEIHVELAEAKRDVCSHLLCHSCRPRLGPCALEKGPGGPEHISSAKNLPLAEVEASELRAVLQPVVYVQGAWRITFLFSFVVEGFRRRERKEMWLSEEQG